MYEGIRVAFMFWKYPLSEENSHAVSTVLLPFVPSMVGSYSTSCSFQQSISSSFSLNFWQLCFPFQLRQLFFFLFHKEVKPLDQNTFNFLTWSGQVCQKAHVWLSPSLHKVGGIGSRRADWASLSRPSSLTLCRPWYLTPGIKQFNTSINSYFMNSMAESLKQIKTGERIQDILTRKKNGN